MSTTATPTTGFYVWHRKLREPIAGPFATREAARAVQVEQHPGDPRVIVRRVEVEHAPPRIASPELITELRRLLDALSEVADADVRAIAENTRARLFGADSTVQVGQSAVLRPARAREDMNPWRYQLSATQLVRPERVRT